VPGTVGSWVYRHGRSRIQAPVISSRRIFRRNTIPPQGIGGLSLISEGKAPIPCGKSYSSEILVRVRFRPVDKAGTGIQSSGR